MNTTASGTVTSADGTLIAFDRLGDGPPLVVVLGAFNDRSTHRDFVAELARHFTVTSYDRRGRGSSGDTLPYSVDKEIADLAVVAGQMPGVPAVFGYSSGAVLALAAVAGGLEVRGLALYEPPPLFDGDRPGALAAELDQLVTSGRRGDAVELFQTSIGIPAAVVAQLRDAPFRAGLEKMAHTLVYDTTITGGALDVSELAAAVDVSLLVQVGSVSPPPMRDAAAAIVAQTPNARLQVLEGQNHDIVPEVVAAALAEFLID